MHSDSKSCANDTTKRNTASKPHRLLITYLPRCVCLSIPRRYSTYTRLPKNARQSKMQRLCCEFLVKKKEEISVYHHEALFRRYPIYPSLVKIFLKA